MEKGRLPDRAALGTAFEMPGTRNRAPQHLLPAYSLTGARMALRQDQGDATRRQLADQGDRSRISDEMHQLD